MTLTNIKVEQVIQAVDKLNSRPRKCLGYKTADRNKYAKNMVMHL